MASMWAGRPLGGYIVQLLAQLSLSHTYLLCRLHEEMIAIKRLFIYFIKYGLCEVAVGRKMTPVANQASQPSLHKVYWMPGITARLLGIGLPLQLHSGKNV